MSCSPRPPNTHTHTQEPRKQTQLTINTDNLRWIQSTSFLLLLQPCQLRHRPSTTITSDWVRVYSPEVWPCRECECMCECWVRSIVLSIWNIRRSSSSRAMSPQKTAAEKQVKFTFNLFAFTLVPSHSFLNQQSLSASTYGGQWNGKWTTQWKSMCRQKT